MKLMRNLAIAVFCTAVALVVSAQAAQAKEVPKDIQQALISLDKE